MASSEGGSSVQPGTERVDTAVAFEEEKEKEAAAGAPVAGALTIVFLVWAWAALAGPAGRRVAWRGAWRDAWRDARRVAPRRLCVSARHRRAAARPRPTTRRDR